MQKFHLKINLGFLIWLGLSILPDFTWAQGDDCNTADPIVLGSCEAPFDFSSVGFSGQTPSCGAGALRDEWRSFTVNRNQVIRVEFTLGAAGQNASLALYDGTCGALNEIACADNGATALGDFDFVTFNAQVGRTYYLQVMNLTANAPIAGSLCVSNQFESASTTLASGECDLDFDIPATATTLLNTETLTPSIPFTERWVRYVADETTELRVRYTSTNVGTADDVALIAYDENAQLIPGTVTDAVNGVGTEELVFSVTAGDVYYLRLINPDSDQDVDGSICIQNAAPETAANASPISDFNCNSDFYILGTGTALGSAFGGAAQQDGWASFVATANSYTITYTNTNEDAGLALYENDGTTLLSQVNATGVGLEQITVGGLTPGNTYRVRVANLNSTNRMDGTLCVFPSTSPVEDNSANCGTNFIDLSDATEDCGIPFTVFGNNAPLAYPGACNPTETPQRDGWASFTAPFTGEFTIQFSNLSDLDASIIVRTTDCTTGALRLCVDNLPGRGTEVGILNAIGGDTYFVRVVNTTDANIPMPGELCISTGTPPLADLCSNADEISVGTCGYQFDISNEAVNLEAVDYTCPGTTVFRDAWVQFPVVAGQKFIASYNSLDSDAAIALYSGECGSLVQLTTNGGTCDGNEVSGPGMETLEYTVTANDILYMRVMKVDESGPMTGTLCVSTSSGWNTCAEAIASPTYLETGDCDVELNVYSSYTSTAGNLGCRDGSVDAWVAYTADNNQEIRIDYVASNGTFPEFAVYEASFVCGAADITSSLLVCQQSSGAITTNSATFTATTGTTYLIKVNESVNAEMLGAICLYPVDDGSSDFFFNTPAPLNVGVDCGIPFNIPTSFEPDGGTGSTILSCTPGVVSQRDAWARFVAPASGDIVIEYDNRNPNESEVVDVAVELFSGPTVTERAPAAGEVGDLCTDLAPGDAINVNTVLNPIPLPDEQAPNAGNGNRAGQEWVRFVAPDNQDLTIRLEANWDVQIELFTANCADPTPVLEDAGSFNGSSEVETLTFTPAAGQTYFISMTLKDFGAGVRPTDAAVSVEASLGIFQGITAITCVNADNSNAGGIEQISLNSLTPGDTYYVRVVNVDTEKASETVTGLLCVREGGTEPGDLCDDPIGMLVGDCDRSFDLSASFIDYNSSVELPAPSCVTSPIQKDGWVTFVATNTRTTVQYDNTLSAGTDAVIAIYRGNCISPFLIGCENGQSGTNGVETLKFNTIPGTEYKIRIMNIGTNANMVGRICLFNTAERNVCNDDDLVTLNVEDCNIRFDVPASFDLNGAEPRDHILPFTSNNGSIDQTITREMVSLGCDSNNGTDAPSVLALTAGVSRDAWIRLNGNGDEVTLIYQNNEGSSDPAIFVYTALEDVGPVDCGVGSNGAGNELNQYACGNEIVGVQIQSEAITFPTNAGQRYIIRIVDVNDADPNNDIGMTGTLCVSSGSQDYDDCATAREFEVGDCSIPLNVVAGLSTCYVPPSGYHPQAEVDDADCGLSAATFGVDGCNNGTSDSWATFTVDATQIPGGILPENSIGQTDVTLEYDNRNYTFDEAADVAILVYTASDCNNGNTFRVVACSDDQTIDGNGRNIEGVETVTITNVSDGDTFYVRVINKNNNISKTLFGKLCSFYGDDAASASCPPLESYGDLNGEFRNFTVGNTSAWTDNTEFPSSTIMDPPCVVPGGSNPRTRNTDPIRAHGWVEFTVPVSGLTPPEIEAVTVQYTNEGFTSGGNVQNAAVAVYSWGGDPLAQSAQPTLVGGDCALTNDGGLDNRLVLIDCIDTVFEGSESVTIGVEEGRTYYVRVMNIANVDNPSEMPGRIRIFPYAPCEVSPDELVFDGSFSNWSAIARNEAHYNAGLPEVFAGELEASNVTNADYNRRNNDVMVTPRVNNRYPNQLDWNARFATDYGFLRDRNQNGNLSGTNGITDSTDVYNNFRRQQYELNPEGRYLVKQSPWTVKGDWFSFGNGYSGYGGRTGGGTPRTSYCQTGGGGFGGEPCEIVIRDPSDPTTTTEGNDGTFNTALGIPSPFPYSSDANFMIVNGSFDPSSGLPPGKVWCQTVERNGATVGYYVFSVWVQNMISDGRNLDVPQLRLTVCDMENPDFDPLDPTTGTQFPDISDPAESPVQGANVLGKVSILPGVTLFDPSVVPYTVHDPSPGTINRTRAPRVTRQYGAAMPCNLPTESRDARLKVLGSSFLIDEAPDKWQVVRCIYRAPVGVNEMNICVENLSLTKNGNDFGIDDISFRECLNPDQEAFDRLLRGDPCELADTPTNLDIPLSVTMLDFNGKLIGDQVYLTWLTLQEYNTAYFEVQRSIDGANFITVGEVAASRESNALNNYNFIDRNLPQGVETLYYRLKTVSTDGVKDNGPLLRLSVSGLETFDMTLIPNPISQGEELEIQANLNQGGAALIISDLMGVKLFEDIVETNEGDNSIFVNTSTLSPGIYIIAIQQNGRKVSRRLVVH